MLVNRKSFTLLLFSVFALAHTAYAGDRVLELTKPDMPLFLTDEPRAVAQDAVAKMFLMSTPSQVSKDGKKAKVSVKVANNPRCEVDLTLVETQSWEQKRQEWRIVKMDCK
jgi:hypothetical protein